jgi:hypothetical protein
MTGPHASGGLPTAGPQGSQVLQNQRAACDQSGAQEPDQQGDEKAHGWAILLQAGTASIPRRMGLSRSTASQPARSVLLQAAPRDSWDLLLEERGDSPPQIPRHAARHHHLGRRIAEVRERTHDVVEVGRNDPET